MKKIIAGLLCALLAVGVQAADQCESKAAEKKLAGAAKTSFVKKCRADAQGDGQGACEARATEKKLAGAARNSFVKKCVADGAAAAPSAEATCKAAADDKKLAGAARNSFMKKCVADAGSQ